MSSYSIPANSYEDRYDVNLQTYYSRELAHNASQIRYYEEHLEKALKLPQATREDIDYIKKMIDVLFEEREQLSEKYMKAVRNNN